MAIPATQIRRGMVIVFEGQPCKVLEFRHHTPGNLRAMIQTKLRNIRTGASFEHRFRSADTVDRASLEQHEMEYLYSDGSHHHFMNTENYEQTALSEDELGDASQRLARYDWQVRPVGKLVERVKGLDAAGGIGVREVASKEQLIDHAVENSQGTAQTKTHFTPQTIFASRMN